MVFNKSLLSAMLLWAFTKQSEAVYRAINVANVGANISATPEGLRVSWKNPNKEKGSHCYESTVRFKTTCDPAWENFTTSRFSYEVKTGRRAEYQFQIRMKYHGSCETMRSLNHWTTWTPTLSLGNPNDTRSCRKETPPPPPPPPPATSPYLVTLLPLLLCSLLLCSLTQERVRRYFLPIIPDPNHRLDRLFKMEMSQHCAHPEMECETVDIEIVHSARGDAAGPGEDGGLLEADTGTKGGEEGGGHGGRESWARGGVTEAGLRGYPTRPTGGEYIVYHGRHSDGASANAHWF